VSALAELAQLGLRARIGTGGRLQVGPPDRLTAEARALVARLAADLRAELEQAAEPRFRAWRCRMTNGRYMIVMRPTGMTRAECLEAVDGHNVVDVQPMPASIVEGAPC
jgi:hypothetical protein